MGIEKGKYEINSIFPSPIYMTKRDFLSGREEKEIEEVLKEGMKKQHTTIGKTDNSLSNNTHIFNTRLFNLKEFIEKHIKIYIEKIISPKEELDFYITQSWLISTRPGESHHVHKHPNGLISGIFYVSTVEEDGITFHDTAVALKEVMYLTTAEYNLWNSKNWFFPIENNVLVMFPSWMLHSVTPNEKATTDRISLAFNVFARGVFGADNELNELIL